MAEYSREDADQSAATDKIEAALLSYPPLRQCAGVTFQQLNADYPSQFKCYSSFRCAVSLLVEEGKARYDEPSGRVILLTKLTV
jgi:hypothetical protein